MTTAILNSALCETTVKLLRDEGITTVEGLAAKKRSDIRWLPGIGRARLADITRLLDASGLQFADDFRAIGGKSHGTGPAGNHQRGIYAPVIASEILSALTIPRAETTF